MTPHFNQRRTVLLGGAGALLSSAFPAAAQTPPIQGTVRLVVGFAPGGTTDVLARILAEKMRPVLGTDVIVDNRPGASGMIAAEHVARSAPDGRTILATVAALVQAPSLMPRLNFDPLKDLEPVTSIARGSTVLVVPANLPVNSVSDFVALARSQPGKHSIGNYGNASSGHIQGEAFARQANIDVVQVAFRGGAPLITAVLGGQISAAISDFATAIPQVRAGKLKALAVCGSRTSPIFPSAPTLSSLGYRSVDMDGWIGIFVPTGVPAPAVAKLHEAASQAAASTDMRERIEAIGMRPDAITHEEFARMVKRDAQAWAQVISETKVRAE